MGKMDDFTPEKIDKLVKKDKNHNELPFSAEKMKIRRWKNQYKI